MMTTTTMAAVALQLAVTLSPGEHVTVGCPDSTLSVSTSATVTVRCEAPPPPPPPPPPPGGDIVLGDAAPLPGNGGGVVIHQSSGFFVAGPNSAPLLTAEGAFHVDDRAGGVFMGLGCALDSIELHVGGDYRGWTHGIAVIRI